MSYTRKVKSLENSSQKYGVDEMRVIHLNNTKGPDMYLINTMTILAGYFYILAIYADAGVLSILAAIAAISTIVMNVVKFFRERPKKRNGRIR